MKKQILIIAGLFISTLLFAQSNPINVVFDVTGSDKQIHEKTIRHVKGMSNAYPDTKFEVVVYSGALDMYLKGKSSVANDIEELAKNPNVSFKVCEQTMKRHNKTQSDLLEGVEPVPDGILEIVSKQRQGWGYIKESY
ncbi:DsrE family protein [Mangrovivirga sp. M17]|uniref:DsrE family protein n=1 Tax=Mangrovivirga halotolerans TaxID=2993936 RepID=A0ABT3RN97_9BACT|nr:DsrE family protein [Mangrovivirga halotolerans]MCX2743279.1 DsrE family protein [Mangrovivirga halotolerans]